MTEADVTQIRIGKTALGIVGLALLIEEMAKTHADKPDDEVRSFMLERLAGRNYMPASAKEEYGNAFVREFRKSLGQHYAEDTIPRGIDIKVLGPGCNQCDALTEMVMAVLTEINVPAEIEHVRDVKAIASYGIMGSPALIINRKVVAIGSVPPRENIKKWLVAASASLPAR